MQGNQSWFVKAMIWVMVVLMSLGFVLLIVAPFVQGGSIFGGSGRDATRDRLEESRTVLREERCTDDDEPKGERLDRCKRALAEVGSAYVVLSRPDDSQATATTVPEPPADAERNLDRAEDAFLRLYELDRTDQDSAQRLATFYRDRGTPADAAAALPIWASLVKRYPDNPDYLYFQAIAAASAGKNDEAIATLKTFRKRFPNDGKADDAQDAITQLQQQAAGAGAAGGAAGGAPPVVVN